MKRPTLDEYFLHLATGVALRSECSKRQVGAVITDAQKRILATGYNGFANGEKNPCADSCLKLTGQECPAVHAELNALLNCADLHRAETIYITRRPCKRCIQHMANTSITRIVLPKSEDPALSKYVDTPDLNPLPVRLSYVFAPTWLSIDKPEPAGLTVQDLLARVASYHTELGYPKPYDNEEDRSEQFRHLVLALQMEVAEIAAAMPWKPWRPAKDQQFDLINLTEEVVDLIFFVGSILELYDVSSDTLCKAFFQKLEENYNRILDGYNKSKEDM